ncbi:PQQ-dependent sugar dehydrogenase [Rhodobium gokarnense]|uniref:Glucose/arabinose dehydrogenase n=1 Tax=Rhodobium gokarnense TaxID=364296 RepID=A0ABT3H5Y4_9HYPH|nr:PQQ-dependent sugar dehydrogenase [Rhodobium gokarnense]MCW2305797.1 glucose/arabinose dehydrogenase [Rhodobium gokarnense]
MTDLPATDVRPRGRRSGAILTALALITGAAPAAAETFRTDDYTVDVSTVASGLEHPWSLAFLPDGTMLVTERPGRLRLVVDRTLVDAPVSGVPDVYASGQGGLLDVVPAPDFADSNLIFLSYAERGDGGAGTAVARARLVREGMSARLEDVEVIFRQQPKTTTSRHFGSRLVFAPDGMLFVTLGERGQRPLAQDLSTHNGKVVRIVPDGSVPDDNPFVGTAGARPEIWSYGHRNPQGAALNPETGELWTVAHGARGGDEVNIPKAGRNYGWPVISYGRHYSGQKIGVGTHKEGMEQPVYYWDPSIAPSGAAFYDGDLFPEWKGDLFVGALKFQLLSRLDVEDGRVASEERMFEGAFGRIRDVRSGPDGAIWLLTDEANGQLLRVAPAE